MMMQFACTARSADDEDYRPLAETPLTLDFAYDHGVRPWPIRRSGR